MASLFNQQISATYQGLLKTTSNGIITSSLAQITDGSGNGSQLYLSTASINFYNAYSFPNADGSANQVLKTNGSGVLTWQNDSLSNTLNFIGTSGTGSVLLSTQNFSVLGTANEIVTTASNQAITLSFPTAGVTLPNGSVATTQAASDDSTKVATTKYVTDAIGSISSGDVNVVGTPTINQIAIWTNANTIKGMSTLEIATDGTITLSQPNSTPSITLSYNIGGGNIANVTGLNNTGFGLDNLSSLTTGTQNVAIGKSALGDNTEGLSNVSVGYLSLTSNTTGNSNIAIGVQSLQANTYASNNVSIGQSALILNVSGANNTAIGNLSLGANTANSNSTAVGYLSLRNSTGANNTAIGKDSGSAITTGSNNVIIGSNTASTIATSDNNIIISDGSGNNRIQVNSGGNVGIGAVSTETTPSTLHIKGSEQQLTISEGTLRGATFDYRSSTGNLQIATNGADPRLNPQITLVPSGLATFSGKILAEGGEIFSKISSGATAAVVKIGSGSTWQLRSNPTTGTNSYGFDIVQGVGSPQTRFSIASTGLATFQSSVQEKIKLIASSNEYSSLAFANNSGTTQWEISKNDSNELYFYRGGGGSDQGIKLTIASEGELVSKKGIEFQGNSLTTGQTGVASSGSGGDLRFYTNGNQSVTIKSSGQVGVGISQSLFALQVIGTMYSTDVKVNNLGSGSVFSSGAGILTNTNPSDSRLKRNIENIDFGLSEILKLRSIKFNWLDGDKNSKKQFGFIAQEVKEIIPESVSEFDSGGNKRLGLEKDAIYVGLVKAIQEQQTIIEDLKLRIEKLEL